MKAGGSFVLPSVVMAVAVFAIVVPGAANGAGAASAGSRDQGWLTARSRLERSVAEYLRVAVESAPGDSPTEARSGELLRGVETALRTALSRSFDDPPLVQRIRSILPVAGSLAPEARPLLLAVMKRGIVEAILGLRDAEVVEYAELMRELWRAGSGRRGSDTVIARVMLGPTVGLLLGRVERPELLYDLARELLRLEVESIEPVAHGLLSPRAAMRVLTRQPESPTIHALIDSLSQVHQRALTEADPNAVLDGLVTVLIDCLRRVEVRVAGPGRREPLPLDDPRAVAQFQLWFRVSDILQRWTGQLEPVWASEWQTFWDLYRGDDAPQGRFDFREARRSSADPERAGTVVRRRASPSASLFGVETRTARFLVIVDVSGSMVDNPDGLNRLAGLKRETLRFMKDLRPGSQLNILPFSRTCNVRESLSGGHDLVVKTAPRGQISPRFERWIEALEAGGSTRADLAFRTAFGAEDANLRGSRSARDRPGFREIYFITDGSPTDAEGTPLVGEGVDSLLDMIRGLNGRHHVVIHAIAFPGMRTHFLRELARQNGGTTKTIDRALLAAPEAPEPPGR